MFREVADKHAVEQPQQEFVYMVSTIFGGDVCDNAINAKTFAMLQALDARTQLFKSDAFIQACTFQARSKYTWRSPRLGSHQGAAAIEVLKASGCAVSLTGQAAAQCFEDPPEVTCVLGSHLTQLHIALALQRLLHPVNPRTKYLMCSH